MNKRLGNCTTSKVGEEEHRPLYRTISMKLVCSKLNRRFLDLHRYSNP